MKRVPLRRKTPLKARSLAAAESVRRMIAPPLEPGELEWKRQRIGTCRVCGRYGPVVLHHLVDKSFLKRELSRDQRAAGLLWDRRNALQIGAPEHWGGCQCHARHTTPGSRVEDRLDFKFVHDDAKRFAAEVLGEGRAQAYWERHYRG